MLLLFAQHNACDESRHSLEASPVRLQRLIKLFPKEIQQRSNYGRNFQPYTLVGENLRLISGLR